MSSVSTPRRSSTSNSAGAEVVPDRPDRPHLGEEAGGQGEVHGGAAEHPLPLPEWGLDGVESDGSDDGEGHRAASLAALLRVCSAAVKAIQIEEFGGPEVLRHVEVPEPVAGEGEVVVEVARSGINFADTHATRNDYLAEQQLPLIPGAEVSGRTADGRRVAAILPSGGYAEKVAVPESFLVPVPDEVDDDQAAALLLAGADRDGAGAALRAGRAGRDDRRSRPPPAAPGRSRCSSPSRPGRR